MPILTNLMSKHQKPERLQVAERCRFDRRVQGPSESVAEFVFALQALAEHCGYCDGLSERLRDRLVAGIRSIPTQRALMIQKNLTYDTAFQTAISTELALKV
uniref:Retrotransposon gag domain-containing protein n=1 Tax=Strigamia maritima TaxID=126957 RepID=T1IGX3_STRMM